MATVLYPNPNHHQIPQMVSVVPPPGLDSIAPTCSLAVPIAYLIFVPAGILAIDTSPSHKKYTSNFYNTGIFFMTISND